MSDERRNARVVSALVTAMTLGALVLFALEPKSGRALPANLLIAESGLRLTDATIDFAAPGHNLDLAAYDCVVFPDGQAVWQPLSPSIRVAVVGDGGERLSDVQREQLLALLGNMKYLGGLRFDAVKLDSESDPTVMTGLPAQAFDLRALLVRKGILR